MAEADVVIVQPAMTMYRRPFFQRLAMRCRSLTVVHGDRGIPGGCAASASPAEGVRDIAVRHSSIGPLIWMPDMWAVAGERMGDVVVFSWNSRYAHLPLSLLRARNAGKGVVLWGHGYSSHDTPGRRRYRNFLARLAHVVVTYNRSAARAVVAAGIADARVIVARNALDASDIDAASAFWKERHSDLGRFAHDLQPGGSRLVVHCSRLSDIQRVAALVRAWSCIAEREATARLVVIGDGPAREQLAQLIAERGLQKSVRCVGAIYDERLLAQYFLSARLILHPARLGLSLNHAMTYGVPVATLDDRRRHGPEFEALQDGINGIVCPAGDYEGLADRCVEVLRDEHLQRRLGDGARMTMEQHYTLDGMVNSFVRAVNLSQQLRAIRSRGSISSAVTHARRGDVHG